MARAPSLSPTDEPHARGWLPVAHGHAVYWEQFGNRAAPALLWLHGGPGSGCSPRQRQQFDAARWHVTFVDQRGCGRSRAEDDLRANTTAHLIADLERLRRHLGLARWTVCGGSWGATLALAYAAAHGPVVEALVLRSVFLAERAQVDALLQPPPPAAGAAAGLAWAGLLAALGELSADPS
ncbi:MAG: alpha/beta fold hydrolase, partial [Comamonas sp.]